MAAAGIDASVLVQTVAVRDETAELLAVANAQAPILGVVGWVDLTADDVADWLGELRSGPCGQWLVGIRHPVQDERDPRWLMRDDVARGLAAVGENDLAYDLLITHPQLPAAVDVCMRLPQVNFVLDHAGKPDIAGRGLEPWRSHVTKLAQLPNVAVKLSGFLTEATPDWTLDELRPFAQHLLESFGPSRVMFGSDWPVCTLRAEYAEVVSVTKQLTEGLDRKERASVFGGTAASTYGLRVAERAAADVLHSGRPVSSGT